MARRSMLPVAFAAARSAYALALAAAPQRVGGAWVERDAFPVPLLSPALSSLWVGAVTPVDSGVVRPLVEGLSTETAVAEPRRAALFDTEPRSFAATVRDAVAERAVRA